MDSMAVANLAVGAVSAVAAVAAAVYAKKSPSKEDLERVELNTARSADHIALVEQHIGQQQQHEDNRRIAETVQVVVSGESINEEPLILTFSIGNTRVNLPLIQLTNTLKMPSGTFTCTQAPYDPTIYTARIERRAADNWYNSGDVRAFQVRLVSIRAFLSLEGRDIERTFHVEMLQIFGAQNVLRVSGQC